MTSGRKARPNDPCPCGSGRKYKKCCAATANLPSPPVGAAGFTRDERARALDKLSDYIVDHWGDEDLEAFGLFLGEHEDPIDEDGADDTVEAVFDGWFAFDFALPGGRNVTDAFLAQTAIPLSPGERAYLEVVRRTRMHVYEVMRTSPGASVTLRDLLEGGVVTVHERSASRQLAPGDWLGARILPVGASGLPELERGVLLMPGTVASPSVRILRDRRAEAANALDFYDDLPPLLHDIWATIIRAASTPQLANTDGETLVWTRVRFAVLDRGALKRALDGASAHGIERQKGGWSWVRGSRSGGTSLGQLHLEGEVLVVEANSVERAARGRELVERLAGAAVAHQATSHEDMQRRVAEARARGGAPRSPSTPEIPPEIAEALVLDYQARHYRAWVDEPVPALDGKTPRQAARSAALRPQLESLIRGLEGMYLRALREQQPAYDPTWMWGELELASDDGVRPPPMAHERVAERVPGSAALSLALAERHRLRADFDDARTILDEAEVLRDMSVARFLRSEDGGAAEPYIHLMAELDLHRRKVFWVDEALSFMLASTQLELPGAALRVPFASFAIVLADRFALALGERLLSRCADDPLAGQLLRVITAYVSERHKDGRRVLEVVLAFDALGADLPSLLRFTVPGDEGSSLSAYLESLDPQRAVLTGPTRRVAPAGDLLRIVINTILYATSAGVALEEGSLAAVRRAPPQAGGTTDGVYHLPGHIDLHTVRRLQELVRAPGGVEVAARFMVRGHWRRPAKGWADQELRWIEPYWKGPELAAVIEKAYRLKT